MAIEIAIAALTAGSPAPRASAAVSGGRAIDKPLADVPLLDERGHPTSLAAFRGRYLVLAPSLTLCHEVCPLTTGALMQLQSELRARGLGDRVVVAEATVDPWRDSPARVRAFKRMTGTDIRFLTGTEAGVRRLWKTLGVAYQRVPQGDPPDVDWWTHKPERFDVTHTDGVFIIDPRGHLRAVLPGMPRLGGRLPARLTHLLNDEGRANLQHPDTPWTVGELRNRLLELLGRRPAPSRLLGGGAPAFREHLATLRGRPVVVNEWASWCPPCRDEMPLLSAASARYAGRVAFIGLNVNDSAGSARRFLGGHPVAYPSFSDDGAKIASSLGHFIGLPTTVFLDGAGRVVHAHTGQYRDAAALDADIDRYAG
jgi:cytochrome oxidase Cu insertion factor (SCO1/SenC/PrrC family)/thiol-disulfide isomerase/thioredoxin